MITIGLTGSIGMGKSTVAAMFADLGAAAWDADGAVHRLYAEGGAGVEPIRDRFPEAVIGDAVDRERLSGIVLGDAAALKDLEFLIHPLVGQDRAHAMKAAEAAGAPAMVLDIPLLFETGGNLTCDVVVVVSAPAEVQRARVLAREGMTAEKFEAIKAKQTPDAEKRAKADYVISTGGSLEETRGVVKRVWEKILEA